MAAVTANSQFAIQAVFTARKKKNLKIPPVIAKKGKSRGKEREKCLDFYYVLAKKEFHSKQFFKSNGASIFCRANYLRPVANPIVGRA